MNENAMHPLIDRERQKIARRYRRDNLKWSIASFVVGSCLLVALMLFGLSERFADLMAACIGAHLLLVAVYFSALYLVFSMLNLPFAFVEGYRIEHKYGFSTQNRCQWFADWLKSSAVTYLLGLIVFEVIYLVIPASPHLWWLWLSLIMIGFSVVLANVFPVVILPLFYKTTAMEEGELTDGIAALCRKACVSINGVYTINLSAKTTKANAAVVGLGNTRRILVGDTLMSKYVTDEILSAVGHEIVHYRERHMWWLILWQSIITVAMFYALFRVQPVVYAWFGFEHAADIAAFPVFAMIFGVLSYGLRPLTSAISRYYERRADRGALGLTANTEAFVSLIAKLCNEQLSIAYPNRFIEWYSYSHPSAGKRIDLAEKLQR